MAFRTKALNSIFLPIFVLSFSVSFCVSNQKTGTVKGARPFDDLTRHGTINVAFPVLSNISTIPQPLLSNDDDKEGKLEGNFRNVGNLLENRTTEEANDEFERAERNSELKIRTPYGNSGRNYNGDEYSRNMAYLIKTISDIPRKRETRNLQDKTVDKSEVNRKGEKTTAESPLSGFYTECLLRLSVPCMQRKMLVYVDNLDRNDFSILGDYLSVVRVGKPPARPMMTEENLVEPRMSTGYSVWALDSLLDHSIKRFFFTHAVRVEMPPWLSVGHAGKLQTLPHGHAVNFSISSTGLQEGKRYFSFIS
jgi:hypothetical protein